MTVPPVAPDGSVPAEPRKRSGCGCLAGGCLFPSVLLVVLLVVGFFAGRALLRNKLPEWQDRYPAVDLAATILRIDLDDAASPEPLERFAGTEDPSSLPKWVDVFPDPASETFTLSEGRVTGYQRIDGAVDEVAAFFRDTMSGGGWTLVEEAEVPGGVVLRWVSGDRACAIEVVEDEPFSEAWIRCVEGISPVER